MMDPVTTTMTTPTEEEEEDYYYRHHYFLCFYDDFESLLLFVDNILTGSPFHKVMAHLTRTAPAASVGQLVLAFLLFPIRGQLPFFILQSKIVKFP